MSENQLETTSRKLLPAQSLREVRRYCKAGPLDTPEELDSFWVDTTDARDPNSILRERLKTKLEDGGDDDLKILVFGHRGSGKSTELVKLAGELNGAYCIVRFSVLDHLNLVEIPPEDVLVLVAERVAAQAQSEQLPVSATTLDAVYHWFAERTVTAEEKKTFDLEIAAQAEAGAKAPGLLALVAKITATLKGDIKLSSSKTSEAVLKVRQRPAELVDKVNLMIQGVNDALHNEGIGRQLLIIVEDLDKLDIKQARRMFIENANLLTSLAGTAIYTIPLFVFHSPDANILHASFSDCVSLPMIKVRDSDGSKADGYEVVKRIVRRRVSEAMLTEDALDLLIEKTGGVLRHVFDVLHTAAAMTNAQPPLARDHIRYGLNKKKQDFYNEITPPFGGIPSDKDPQKLVTMDDLYERLVQLAANQRDGKENPPQSGSVNQVLLKCCAIVEYNGDGWHGVHPLVMEILEDMGKLDPMPIGEATT